MGANYEHDSKIYQLALVFKILIVTAIYVYKNLLFLFTRNFLEKQRFGDCVPFCDQHFVQFFKMDGILAFCTDINGLMSTLNISYKPYEWRLFIDSSKTSLKAVLLYNGNTLPSIPIGHAKRIKESYENIQHLLVSIKHEEYK